MASHSPGWLSTRKRGKKTSMPSTHVITSFILVVTHVVTLSEKASSSWRLARWGQLLWMTPSSLSLQL